MKAWGVIVHVWFLVLLKVFFQRTFLNSSERESRQIISHTTSCAITRHQLPKLSVTGLWSLPGQAQRFPLLMSVDGIPVFKYFFKPDI